MKLVKIAFFIAALSLLPITVQATIVPYKNFNQLVDESDHVVGGTVEAMQSTKRKNGDIYTTVVLSKAFYITEAGRKDTDKPIKIRYKGGVVPVRDQKGLVQYTKVQWAVGTPELNEGDRVILFLSHNGIADMPIYGWEQGLFFIDAGENVLDSKKDPVVGLAGADLVVSHGAMVLNKKRGGLIQKQEQESELPALVSSEGGQDVIVSRGTSLGSGAAVMAKSIPLHAYSFISKIQERKALVKNTEKRAAVSNREPADLFTLPELADSGDVAIGDGEINIPLVEPLSNPVPRK